MKQNFLIIASILIFSILASQAANAQWIQTHGPFSARNEGLLASGANLYVGADAIYRSQDSGNTWTMQSKSSTPIYALERIGTYLFAGADSGYVLRSTDDGESWGIVNRLILGDSPFARIYRLATVGTDLFAGTWGFGILRSTDSGLHWSPMNSGLGDLYVDDFEVQGTNLFAAMVDAIYRSSDHGSNWTVTDSGKDRYRTLSSTGTTLYAYGSGVDLRSDDDGNHWSPCRNTPGEVVTFLSINGYLFAGSDHGVFRSSDNGMSWTQLNTGLSGINLNGLTVMGSFLIASSSDSGIWRRPLSEMIGTSAVAPTSAVTQPLTAYHNPSTQSTTISFTSTETRQAEITIVNLLGEEVSRVFSGALTAGPHSFTWDNRGLPPGTYECVARVDGNVERVRVVHLP